MVVTEERLAPARRIDVERIWMKRLGIAWAVVVTAIYSFEPAPTNPNAPVQLWAAVTGIVFLATLGAMAVTAVRRHRLMFGISAFGGVLGMVLAYACLASGHHLGAWWLVELGAFGGLTTMSIAADRAR